MILLRRKEKPCHYRKWQFSRRAETLSEGPVMRELMPWCDFSDLVTFKQTEIWSQRRELFAYIIKTDLNVASFRSHPLHKLTCMADWPTSWMQRIHVVLPHHATPSGTGRKVCVAIEEDTWYYGHCISENKRQSRLDRRAVLELWAVLLNFSGVTMEASEMPCKCLTAAGRITTSPCSRIMSKCISLLESRIILSNFSTYTYQINRRHKGRRWRN